jgi:hypothetical protein
LVLACTRARKTLNSEGTAWEGQAWELMVQRLAEFAHERGLPVSARKDSDKRKRSPSPFVSFVKAIQDQFPSEVPIRFSTEDGLAQAISQVLRQMRKHGIDFGSRPAKQIPHPS